MEFKNVKSLYKMFYDTHIINNTNIGLSKWNISNVERLDEMFAYSNFNEDISKWNTKNVYQFEGMFAFNLEFNQDISNWDVSSGINFNNMFK